MQWQSQVFPPPPTAISIWGWGKKTSLVCEKKSLQMFSLLTFWSPYNEISDWYVDTNTLLKKIQNIQPEPQETSWSVWVTHILFFFLQLLLLFTWTHTYWQRVPTSLVTDVTMACWFITPTLTSLPFTRVLGKNKSIHIFANIATHIFLILIWNMNTFMGGKNALKLKQVFLRRAEVADILYKCKQLWWFFFFHFLNESKYFKLCSTPSDLRDISFLEVCCEATKIRVCCELRVKGKS